MRNLSIDLETYSETDIKACGAYKYAETAEILLFAFSFDNDPVTCIDVACGEEIPAYVIHALTDPEIKKTAHNAPFEIAILQNVLMIDLNPFQWRCSAVMASMAGLPMSLDESTKALGMELKDSRGKALIRYFCMPCKPTKANGGRTRNYPHHDPEKWLEFIEYCKQDVVAEKALSKSMPWVVYTKQEHMLWCADHKINSRGWKVDTELAEKAIEIDTINRKRLVAEAKKVSGLSNPNSVAQVLEWFKEEGVEINDLTKGTVSKLLKEELSTKVRRMLELRQELSKTSIKKYTSMLHVNGVGGRARGLFQFNGAGRTGRWAGRLIQVQNLPRINMSDEHLMLARELVKAGDLETLDLVVDSIPNALSQLIRTSFVAEKGKRLIILDFSAIEARVLAWLAGQEWVLDVFRTHGKIYEATAAQMLKIPIDAVTKSDRQKGKVATLALGYQGGVNALKTMGAIEMGIAEEDLQDIVDKWRAANPKIVQFWHTLGRTAINTVQTGEGAHLPCGITFNFYKGALRIRLPSGRYLCYPYASVEPGQFGDQLTFWGVDGYTKKWSKQSTYGGKLAENLTQAIARDCLANSIMNLDEAGINIVAHVHDEGVAEEKNGTWPLDKVREIMLKPADWMKGLPLNAEGGESMYYNK